MIEIKYKPFPIDAKLANPAFAALVFGGVKRCSCGGKADVIYRKPVTWVRCEKCGRAVAESGGREKAIERWNGEVNSTD